MSGMGHSADSANPTVAPLTGAVRVADHRMIFALMGKDPTEEDRRRIRSWCSDKSPVEVTSAEADRIKVWQSVLWNEAVLAGKAEQDRSDNCPLERRVRITTESGTVMFPRAASEWTRWDAESRPAAWKPSRDAVRWCAGQRPAAGSEEWIEQAWSATIAAWHQAASLAHELDLHDHAEKQAQAADDQQFLYAGWHYLGEGVWMNATAHSTGMIQPDEQATT